MITSLIIIHIPFSPYLFSLSFFPADKRIPFNEFLPVYQALSKAKAQIMPEDIIEGLKVCFQNGCLFGCLQVRTFVCLFTMSASG